MPSAADPASSIAGARILITGGLGFIGSWLARALVGRGNRLVLLDQGRYEGSSAEGMGLREAPGVTVLRGDILQPQIAELGTDFDYIVHTAAILGITKVVERPLETLDVNIRGTRNLLELAAAQKSLRRFALFSTSEIYGPQALEAVETDPMVLPQEGLRWGYAASKAACEFLGRAFHAQHGVPVAVVRPFNVYGPHRVGSNAMSTLVRRALLGEELQLSGDGEQVRAWCFVTDFIDGLARCLVDPAAVGEAFNVGDDREPLTLHALARKIIELTGSRSAIRLLHDATPDVRRRAPNVDKARRVLGYEPRMPLDAGIIELAAWTQARPRTAAPKVGAA